MIPWFFPHNDYVCWGPAFQEVAKHLPPNGKQGISSSFCFACVCNLLLSLLTCHYLDPQVFSPSFYFPFYHEGEWLSSCVFGLTPANSYHGCTGKTAVNKSKEPVIPQQSAFMMLYPSTAFCFHPQHPITEILINETKKKRKERGSLSWLGGWCTWHTKKSYTELGFLILERLPVCRGGRVGG